MLKSKIMRNWLIVAHLTLLMLAIANSSSPAIAETKTDRVLLAIVDSDSIYSTDIEANFSGMHGAMSAKEKTDFDYRKLLNKLVNDRLIAHEAEAMGLADESYFTEFMHKQEQALVTKRYVQLNFKVNDSISESSIQEYFKEYYKKIAVRTIAVENRATADTLLQLVKAGAPMDSLAKAHSVDIYRYQGGLHSKKYWADLEVELRSQISSFKNGTLFGPFPYRKVYAIMRLEDASRADTAELAANREYIRAILKTFARDKAQKEFLAALRTKYSVVIDSAAIRAISKSTESVLDSSFVIESNKPIATLAGKTIVSEGKLRKETAHSAMTQATLPTDSLLYIGLDELLEDAVLYRAGMDSKLDTLSAIQRKLAATRDSALVEIYLKQTVVSRIKFNHEEFKKYYDEHPDEFRDLDELNLRQVLIGSKERADSAVAMLAEGADFDYVAGKFRKEQKELSEKTEWVGLSVFPDEIRAQMDKLTPGKSSPAFATPDGWIIFKVLDRRAGRQKTLEEADIKIREIMFQSKFAQMLDETLAGLKKNSKIVFFDEAINQYLGAEN